MPLDDSEVGNIDDLNSDFRKVVENVKKDDKYYYIIANHAGKRYKIFDISKFDKKIDSKKIYMPIPARRLKDIPSTIFRASRHLMFNVVITYHNIPRYIIEPRAAAAGRLLASKLGIEGLDELRNIINGGYLINLLDLVPAEVEEERDDARKKVKRLRTRLNQQGNKVDELLLASESLDRQNGTILGDISRTKDKLLEESNIRHSLEVRNRHLDARIRQLEIDLLAAGGSIPP
jgi:hypothetical protein